MLPFLPSSAPAIKSADLYHESLMNLERKASEFAEAIVDTAKKSKRLEGPDGDDLVALRVLNSVRTSILSAFAIAPGMLQIFSGIEPKKVE